MRVLLSIMLLTLCAAPTAAQQAQNDEYNKFEFFVGYTAQRSETENFGELERFAGLSAAQIIFNFNVSSAQAEAGFKDAFKSGRTQQGFNSSGTFYLNKHLGVIGDFTFSRSRDARNIGNNQLFFEDTSRAIRSSYGFLLGPQVKLRKSRIEPFVRALFGIVRQKNSVTLSIKNSGTTNSNNEVQTLRLRDNYTAFTAAFGGGIDVRVNRHLAIRAIQVDYIPVFARNREARLVAPTITGADGNSLGQTVFDSSRRDGLRISAGIIFR